MRGHPWSIEEDDILRHYDRSDEYMDVLEARGFHRTLEAARSRKKVLQRKEKAPTTDAEALARERTRLEAELGSLERRQAEVRQRLIDIRVETVREAFGNIPVPDEVLAALRDGDGRSP